MRTNFRFSENNWRTLGLLLWLLPMLAITIMVANNPEHRSVMPAYHGAVVNWWQRELVGVLYLPQFWILFAPFHMLPSPIGDILWRWIGALGLAWGLRRALLSCFAGSEWRVFTLISLPVLPLMLGAIRNGQANAHFAAALLLAAAFLIQKYWGLASFCLVITVAIKPIGLAAVGLAVASFPGLRWRILVGILLLTALPFFFDSPVNAMHETASAFNRLRQCETIVQQRFDTSSSIIASDISDRFLVKIVSAKGFADLNGLLGPIGIPLTGKFFTLTKVVVGALVFALLFAIARSGLPHTTKVLLWYVMAASYLVLFNSMTETNSYVILAPAIGLWIWLFLRINDLQAAWILAAVLVSMSLLRNLIRPLVDGDFSNTFAKAWFPAMAIIFAVVLIWKRRMWLNFQHPENQ